ncbi:MAG: hypothetical protein H6732_14255 [Alphaproteobacteria bacterium]|nr:hypothetical protein [Alphaproteobacteria bacterium]
MVRDHPDGGGRELLTRTRPAPPSTDADFEGTATSRGSSYASARPGPLAVSGRFVPPGGHRYAAEAGPVRCVRCDFSGNGSKNNPGYTLAATYLVQTTFEAVDSVWHDNWTNTDAAGLHGWKAEVTLLRPRFEANTTAGGGAALYSTGSTVEVTDGVFEDNEATAQGSGAVGAKIHATSPGVLMFTRTRFTGNRSATGPGAFTAEAGVALDLDDVRWEGNTGKTAGAAHLLLGADDIVWGDLVFVGNTSSGKAGALRVDASDDVALPDLTAHGNSAATNCGAAVWVTALGTGERVVFEDGAWGSASTDNTPGDVLYGNECVPLRLPGTDTVTCTPSGCTGP